MRVATQEEDILLNRISSLVNENYLTENEIMLSESQIKGYKEIRRQKTGKFLSVLITSAFLIILTVGFFINGINSLSIALFMGSGGLGFFALIFIVYAIIVSFRYFAATSKTSFWCGIADKIGIENLDSQIIVNQSSIIANKNRIKRNEEELEVKLSEYFKLKEENDKQFEEDVAAGRRKADFNFDAYNSYIEIDNDWIKFNKLKAELNKISNQKKSLEDDIEQNIIFEDKCKESIRWSVLLFFLMIGTIVVLIVASTFDFEELMLYYIRLAIVLFFMVSGILGIANFVNMIFRFPYISDSKLASFIAEKIGVENTKKDRNDMVEKINSIDARIVEINEELSVLKKIAEEKRDNV